MMEAEYILAEDFFRFVDRAFPGLKTSELSRLLKVDEKRVYGLRQQKTIGFYTADKFLSQLDLSYLLTTGDIPVYSRPLSENHRKYYRSRSKAYLDAVPGA